mgnify:CR=1 FL=1
MEPVHVTLGGQIQERQIVILVIQVIMVSIVKLVQFAVLMVHVMKGKKEMGIVHVV